jgi:hypothetical protein
VAYDLGEYDKEHITRPTRTHPDLKTIKSEIKEFTKSYVEFLCEIPSCNAISERIPYVQAENDNLLCVDKSLPVKYHQKGDPGEFMHILDEARSIIERGNDISRQRATEVMVWVLTNKNRNSTSTIPCSLPIVFGLKDHKLNSDSMRSATNHIFQECTKKGIKVLSFATDGQWIQLMSCDSKKNPQTIL